VHGGAPRRAVPRPAVGPPRGRGPGRTHAGLPPAGYTVRNGSQVVPLINDDVEGTLAGWGGGGGGIDPSKYGQMLAACGAGEFGEAVTEAGKTATGSARQDPALHLQCHALQQALQQVQLAGGPTVLVPGVSPGLLASSAGGGQANRGVSSRLQGVADRLQKLAGRGGVTVSVTRAVRRLAGEETEYVDLVTTTQEGGLNDRQRAFLGRLRNKATTSASWRSGEEAMRRKCSSTPLIGIRSMVGSRLRSEAARTSAGDVSEGPTTGSGRRSSGKNTGQVLVGCHTVRSSGPI
jgi:hypothetical protein